MASTVSISCLPAFSEVLGDVRFWLKCQRRYISLLFLYHFGLRVFVLQVFDGGYDLVWIQKAILCFCAFLQVLEVFDSLSNVLVSSDNERWCFPLMINFLLEAR